MGDLVVDMSDWSVSVESIGVVCMFFKESIYFLSIAFAVSNGATDFVVGLSDLGIVREG